MAKRKNIIIGSRGSRLALAQAEMVLSKLQAQYPRLKFKIKKIKTKGDKIKSAILLRKAGKGLFVKELERALLKGNINIEIHRMPLSGETIYHLRNCPQAQRLGQVRSAVSRSCLHNISRW